MSENRSRSSTAADELPKEGRHRYLLACAGLACLLHLLLDASTCLAQHPGLRISKETTHITEPLTADGKRVDYFAAMERKFYPENMKTDENGYRLIAKNLGDLADDYWRAEDLEKIAAQTLEKLGLEPSDIRQPVWEFEQPSAYEFLYDYVTRNMPDDSDDETADKLVDDEFDNLYDKLHKPWTLDDLPMMAEWLEENGPTLDLTGQAVRKPVFHAPMVRKDESQALFGLMPYRLTSVTRGFARGLAARAHYRIATDDMDGAIDDILACKRLGRHIGRGGPMVQTLLGIAIEGTAGRVGLAASLEHQPTEAQLQRLFDEWEGVPLGMDINESLLAERYASLDLLQTVAHGELSLGDMFEYIPDFPDGTAEFLNTFAGDWNLVAKRMNELHDNVDTEMEIEEPNVRTPKMLLPAYRSRVVADSLGYLVIPAMRAYCEEDRRADCSDNLHRITLAMLIHERRHGTLPPAYTVDASGEALHSWRVLLLPYLGQQALYDKIQLDEPWDSEHNRQFRDETVAFYQCPSAKAAPGQTTYSVVVGRRTAFRAGEGRSRSELGEKSEDMILVVERAQPVCWMDPTQEVTQAVAKNGINVDLPDSAASADPSGIASQHPGGANFGSLDGAVRFYGETIDAQTFKQLLYGTNDGRDD